MNTILIVSPNQADFNMFNAHYGYMPVHYSWAQNPDEAIKYIDLEKPTHIFLISKKIEEMVEWIDMLHMNSVNAPFVCFTKKLDWADREMLWKSNALDIFEFPVNRKELGYILRTFTLGREETTQPIDEHIRGNLADFNVIDLIHTFEKSENDGVLFLEYGARKGKIEFEKGMVYNAEYLDCDPLEAVTLISSWENGVFFARFDKERRQRKIMLENEQIILECRNYRQAQSEMLRKLPAEEVKLFTDPDLEYEEFGPKDRVWFQKFRDGFTLGELRKEYNGNLNFLLKKLLFWIDRKWLMDEETYRRQQANILAEQRKSVLKKFVSKLFSSSAKELTKESKTLQEEVEDDDLFGQVMKKPYLFNSFQLIHSFQEIMEEAD